MPLYELKELEDEHCSREHNIAEEKCDNCNNLCTCPDLESTEAGPLLKRYNPHPHPNFWPEGNRSRR